MLPHWNMPFVASLSITLPLRYASSTMAFTNTHFNVSPDSYSSPTFHIKSKCSSWLLSQNWAFHSIKLSSGPHVLLHLSFHSLSNRFNYWQSNQWQPCMPLLDSTTNCSKMCDHSLLATAYLQEQNILHKRVLSDFLLWISAIILSNNMIQKSIYSSFYFPCLSLFGFDVAFKHLRSYRHGACLQQWYFDQCAATQECHAADTGHDTPPRHSIQTQGRPVINLINPL